MCAFNWMYNMSHDVYIYCLFCVYLKDSETFHDGHSKPALMLLFYFNFSIIILINMYYMNCSVSCACLCDFVEHYKFIHEAVF